MNENILIVDDEKEIADLIEVYLKNDGYIVHKFYNGIDALECIKSQKMDLAILDVMLPDVDGFHICQKIREQYFYPIMYGRILSQNPVNTEYTVFNSSVSYIKQDGRLFQIAHVCRAEKDKKSDIQVSKELYINRCEIGYELPDNTKYEERGV